MISQVKVFKSSRFAVRKIVDKVVKIVSSSEVGLFREKASSEIAAPETHPERASDDF